MILSDVLKAKLEALQTDFLEENSHVNLSALRTPEKCWFGNIMDSLAFVDFLESEHGVDQPRMLADIGTGGGFPLLPLALALPHWSFIGIDSIRKKIAAITRIADRQKIMNVQCMNGRVEAIAHTHRYAQSMDVVTARAVAEVSILLQYAAPLLKSGGYCVLWKSMHCSDELTASEAQQKKLQLRFIHAFPYVLPGDFGERQLLIFRKS